MKHFYLFCLAVLACTTTFSQKNIKLATAHGSWLNKGNWDLNRLPQNSDTIIIPQNTNLTIASDVNLSDVTVKVYGTVTLAENNSQVNLEGNSEVIVYDGGKIQGDLSSQKLRIANHTVFSGNNPPVFGPAMATAAVPSFGVGILPVKFVGFSLSRMQNSDVLVQWSTAEEVNAFSFEVERSTDGNNWNRIAVVKAKGNTSSLTNYSYTDKNVSASLAYYRIKQVDADGKFTYTSVQSVKSAASAAEVKVAAINSRIVLQFPTAVKGAVEVRLVSLSGQVVSRQVLHQPVGQVVLNTTTVKGNHIVSVSNAQDINVAKQVVL
jgi:hypothetical protein